MDHHLDFHLKVEMTEVVTYNFKPLPKEWWPTIKVLSAGPWQEVDEHNWIYPYQLEWTFPKIQYDRAIENWESDGGSYE